MFHFCFSDSGLSEFVKVKLDNIVCVGRLSEGAEYAKYSGAARHADVGSTFVHRGSGQVEDDTFQQLVGSV